jgi:hypothetical protein
MNNDATMKEKRDVLRNDLRVRERGSTSSSGTSDTQGSTYLSHTHTDIGGRFAAISSPHVVGTEAIPKYPAAFLNCDPVPQEPSLGYAIDALNPSDPEQSCSLSSQDAALATPSPSSQAPPLADEGLGFSQRAYRRF